MDNKMLSQSIADTILSMILPFSVQVHHSFVDGVHIGKLANVLQDYLDNFE